MSDNIRGEIWAAIRQRIDKPDIDAQLRQIQDCETTEMAIILFDDVSRKLTDAVMVPLEKPHA